MFQSDFFLGGLPALERLIWEKFFFGGLVASCCFQVKSGCGDLLQGFMSVFLGGGGFTVHHS